MSCKVCESIPISGENEDCFEKALNNLKRHYVFYKNALQQRDIELQQLKERNEKLNKALNLLQNSQQPNKRFKSQNIDDCWLGNVSPQEENIAELSLTDDEQMAANKLNVALNSEELFDTTSSSVNNISRSSTEIIQTPRVKESPKRNKQHDAKRCLKDRSNTSLGRTKSNWHTKERSSPVEKSWALKFLHPTKVKDCGEKIGDISKKGLEKKLSLTLKRTNPSKMKQSLIQFNKTKEAGSREADIGTDIIEASPVVAKQTSKAARSWSHRSVQNSNSSCKNLTNEAAKEDLNVNKTLDDIVFDFSPSKKPCSLEETSATAERPKEPKCLKFTNDKSSDCKYLPKDINMGISTDKSDSSSVVILTPGTQDIIFVEDDTYNIEHEIDTMDLLADNLDKLKKYESKCLVKQAPSKGLDTFKKPLTLANAIKIKDEKVTQENLKDTKKTDEEKPSCSKSDSVVSKIPKHQNLLFSSEDDEDFMPKPFLIKQEQDRAKTDRKLSFKQRFNIDCEDCEKLIEFLDEKLTDAEIQQHLAKCKRHNNPRFMRQNTPKDFWNPFILSFQADDPRNEILIDNRFKDNNNN